MSARTRISVILILVLGLVVVVSHQALSSRQPAPPQDGDRPPALAEGKGETATGPRPEAPSSAREAAAPTAATPPPAPEESWSQKLERMDRKQFDLAVARMARRVLITRNLSFVENTPLLAADRDRLMQLLGDRDSLDQDFAASALRVGLQPGSEEYQKAKDSELRKLQSGIEELMGASGLKDFEQLRRSTANLPSHLIDLVGGAYEHGAALNPFQRTRSAEVIEELKQSGQVEDLRAPVDPPTGLTAYDQTLLNRLGPILTPVQLQTLRDLRVERNLGRAAMKTLFPPRAPSAPADGKK
ncbi:MAG: hypothetical protein JNN01_05890 [Opitutaceae bacterium]|nr:hypothetical protein [Opitutaceae bacterium]